MDTKEINRLLLDVRRTPTGLEWRLETKLSYAHIRELATFLHKELGHKVSITVKDDMAFLSPKGNPPGGLMTFRERVKIIPDTRTDAYCPNGFPQKAGHERYSALHLLEVELKTPHRPERARRFRLA